MAFAAFAAMCIDPDTFSDDVKFLSVNKKLKGRARGGPSWKSRGVYRGEVQIVWLKADRREEL